MELGAFSVSLTVKNLTESKIFYEKLGFSAVGGEEEQNWLIMQNGDHTIGLFKGMFDNNVLTFNPGWDNRSNELESFVDIREIHQHLKSQGLEIAYEAMTENGPSSFALIDPDGNSILIDQHI